MLGLLLERWQEHHRYSLRVIKVVQMKHLLTATLIATALASQAAAFEMDMDNSELFSRLEVDVVGDLAVGVMAKVDPWMICRLDGELFVTNGPLSTDDIWAHFEVTRRSDGLFDLMFVNNNSGGAGRRYIDWTMLQFNDCANTTWFSAGAYKVHSIDSFQTYSEWISYVTSTYTLSR